jgi:hypothetical protein
MTRLRLALVLLTVTPALPAAAEPFGETLDEALYARILERHTREVRDPARVRVDYAALARSPDWARLVANVSRTRPADLATREERLAYWINVYNIFAMDFVARNLPIESIRDLGSWLSPVWKREAGRIGGRAYTLDEIEHDLLRPMGEPRIHAAIVCASVSCPALRREPWTADRLDAQLDDAMRTWLADTDKGLAFDAASSTVTLSRIFSWFRKDFDGVGGLAGVVERWGPPDVTRRVRERRSDLDFAFFDYDWRLNDLAAGEPEG